MSWYSVIVTILASTLMVCCAREADPQGGSSPTVVNAPAPIVEDPQVEALLVSPDAGHEDPISSDASVPPDSAVGGDESSPLKMAAIHPNHDDLVDPLPPLVIIRRYDGKRFELTPETRDGGFDAVDLESAREAWAFRKGHESHDVHPRLLDLLYQVQRHYDAPHIALTSGYRPDRVTSYHAHGRALDLRVPGVKCRTLAKHLRRYGFVGVGVYPRTGGVHLDVREKSYFWISYAPRGVRWPERGIDLGEAAQMDKQARERGLEPSEPLPRAVQKARVHRSAAQKRRRRRRNAARRRAKAAKTPSKARRQPRRPAKK